MKLGARAAGYSQHGDVETQSSLVGPSEWTGCGLMIPRRLGQYRVCHCMLCDHA